MILRSSSFIRAALVSCIVIAGPASADLKTDQAIAKAQEQFSRGKADEAIKALAKFASGTPSVEAYLALARMQEMNGDREEARASAAKAIEVSASASPALKSQALSASATMAFHSGTGKDALELATKAVAAEKNGESLGTLASAQTRVGDLKSAQATADAAIAANASSSAAHAGKGEALAASGQSLEAVAAFQKAISLDARNANAQIGLAYAWIAAGKPAEGKVAAQKATEINKSSGAAFAALGYAISAEKNFNGADPSWTEAIAQAQQGVFLSPKNPQVHVVVGRLFEARGDYSRAKDAYRVAVAGDPSSSSARIALILSTYRSGDMDGALSASGEFLKMSPDHPEANRIHGEILARKERYKEAIPFLEKAVAGAPRDKDAVAMLAHSYHVTQSLEDAKNAYAKAVELNPSNNDIKSSYGLLLGMSGELDKGAQILQALIATPGYRSAAGYANYGWVLSRMKPPKGAEAIAAYRRALELDGTKGGLQYGLAWAQVFAGQPREAIASFEKAASMDKTLFAETRRGIARANYRIAVDASIQTKGAPDFTATKQALQAAEEAGRPDVFVATAIAKYEKDLKEMKERPVVAAIIDEPEIDLGKMFRQLLKGSITQRTEAATALAAGGAAAAETLGYALETDPMISVREAVVASLRRMGAGARPAIPAMKRYVQTPPRPPDINDTTGSAGILEVKESDLRRDINEILRRFR